MDDGGLGVQYKNDLIMIDDAYQDQIPSNDMSKDQVSTPNKNITITVEDGPDKKKLNSTKIVIEIDDVKSSQEQTSLNICQVTNSIYTLDGMEADDFTLEFLQFLELCLRLEHSDGMLRIIQRNLIPNYRAADRTYVKSMVFQKFLEEVIAKIEMDPQRKFSCMKEVCEELKSSPHNAQARKRVSLVTLDKKVSVHTKSLYCNEVPKKRKKVDEVIDLDKIEDSIDLDDPGSDDVILVSDEKENRNNNYVTTNSLPIPQNTKSNINRPENIEGEVSLSNKEEEIKQVEDHLKHLKTKLKMFEEMDVVRNDNCSPYVICNNLKAEIVSTYKNLCQLTGDEFGRKPKLIRISAPEGHPSGPAERLERLLNSRAAADGEVAFPDFIDVVKCVTEASAHDGLGWARQEILYHARVLFSQCGQALQRRRQRREWRDLVCKVEVGEDPADADPALEARLRENRLHAMRKEHDLFQHFASLENSGKRASKKKSTVIFEPEPAINTEPDTLNNANSGIEISCLMLYPDVTEENITAEMGSAESEDVKPLLIPRPIDPETEIVCSDSEDYSSTDEDLSDFELDVVLNTKTAQELNEDNRENKESNRLQEEVSPNNAENVCSNMNIMHVQTLNATTPTETIKKESSPTSSNETDNKDVNLQTSEEVRGNPEIDKGVEDRNGKAEENVKVKSECISNNPKNQVMAAEDTIKLLDCNEKAEENVKVKSKCILYNPKNQVMTAEDTIKLLDCNEKAEENVKVKSECILYNPKNQVMTAEDTIKLLDCNEKAEENVKVKSECILYNPNNQVMTAEDTIKLLDWNEKAEENVKVKSECILYNPKNQVMTAEDTIKLLDCNEKAEENVKVKSECILYNPNNQVMTAEDTIKLLDCNEKAEENVKVKSECILYNPNNQVMTAEDTIKLLDCNEKAEENVIVKSECILYNPKNQVMTAEDTIKLLDCNEKAEENVKVKSECILYNPNNQVMTAEDTIKLLDCNEKAEENVKVKSECISNNPKNQVMTAEDTIKLLLAFDKSRLESGGASITSTIFDIEEPIIFIDISSSESESDQDDYY